MRGDVVATLLLLGLLQQQCVECVPTTPSGPCDTRYREWSDRESQTETEGDRERQSDPHAAVHHADEPRCSESGDWLPMQCDIDRTLLVSPGQPSGHCWCVDLDGSTISGTDVYIWLDGINDDRCRAARSDPLVKIPSGDPILRPLFDSVSDPLLEIPTEPQSLQQESSEEQPPVHSVGRVDEHDHGPRRFRYESLFEAGLFGGCLLVAVLCGWCQYTGARGRSLMGKEFPLVEMDRAMLPKGTRDESDVPLVVIQDTAGQVAL